MFSTTSARYRARPATARYYAHCAHRSWTSGAQSATRRIGIAIAYGPKWRRWRRRAGVASPLLTAGQTAGGIREVLPVAEIMRRLIAETEAARSRAPRAG